MLKIIRAKQDHISVLHQDEEKNPIKQDTKKGKLRYYPYNINWNYGMIPQTWEDPSSESKDLPGITVRPSLSTCLCAFNITTILIVWPGYEYYANSFESAFWCVAIYTFPALLQAHLTGCDLQGDNDPVDLVEIGSETLDTGSIHPVKPLAVLAMIDDGELDWKVIGIRTSDPKAADVNDVEDVER